MIDSSKLDLWISDWFPLLDVLIWISHCESCPSLIQTQESKLRYEICIEIKLLGVRSKNGYLLFLFEIERWFNPEKIGDCSGDDPGSEILSSSKTSHGVSDERPHVPHRSSPATSHWISLRF